MKKSILLITVASLISTQSLAFRLELPGGGEVKGDDPKIIVVVTEAAKGAATAVSNGVRDAIGYVGNATGITSIIESNKKTIGDIGAVYACFATLCYSEVVKKKQLEEAEQEAREKYEQQVAESQRFYNNLTRKSRVENLNAIITDSEVLLKNLNGQFELNKTLKATNAATLTALNTQMTWNDAMAQQGIKDRPALASEVVRPAVTAFEDKMNRDFDSAIVELNQTLEQLEKTANRTRAELMADFIYTLSDSTLRTFSGILKDEQRKINESLVELEGKIRSVKAKQDSARAKLAKEQA
jgi:hypothetical protein